MKYVTNKDKCWILGYTMNAYFDEKNENNDIVDENVNKWRNTITLSHIYGSWFWNFHHFPTNYLVLLKTQLTRNEIVYFAVNDNLRRKEKALMSINEWLLNEMKNIIIDITYYRFGVSSLCKFKIMRKGSGT